MPKLPYLDDVLTEDPTPFEIVDVGSAKLNVNEKKYYPCVFKLRSTGATSSGCIYQPFLDQLGLTGDDLLGKIFLISKDGRFPKMTLQKSQTGDEIIPPPISNYEEVKREKVVSENISEREKDNAIYSDSVGARGIYQALVVAASQVVGRTTAAETDTDLMEEIDELAWSLTERRHDLINLWAESRHS